jgi:hypothetical protein
VEPITVELDCPTIAELPVYPTLRTHFPIFNLNAPMPASALKALMFGEWILAIKEVRATYGWGLKEAKDYVCYYRDLNKKP